MIANQVDLSPIPVLVGPGIGVVIKMSESGTSRAETLEIDQIADFAAPYAEGPGISNSAFREVVLMILR